MLKSLVPAMVLAVSCPQILSAQGLNVGFLDVRKMMEDSLELQAIKKHSEELRAEYNKLEDQRINLLSTVPRDQAGNSEKDMIDRQKSLKIGIAINQKKVDLYLEKVRNIVKTLAIKHELDVVITDKGGIIIPGEFVDITDELLGIINEK